jgi:hypothetical protein
VGMQAMSRLIANRTILGIRKYDGGKAVVLSTLPSYLAKIVSTTHTDTSQIETGGLVFSKSKNSLFC